MHAQYPEGILSSPFQKTGSRAFKVFLAGENLKYTNYCSNSAKICQRNIAESHFRNVSKLINGLHK